MHTIQTGLDSLLQSPPSWLKSCRLGLIANPTTITSQFEHAADILHQRYKLVRLFGPEHGIRGMGQYMETMGHDIDPATGLPVVSLYGATEASLTPQPEQLQNMDALIFDIQDIGTRYYTYAATMALCCEAAARAKIPVIICDRPNPIGSAVEGGGLDPFLKNFCGLYPVPQRHGLTVGELARLYQKAFQLPGDIHVIECKYLKRDWYYDEINVPWVMPSPNMPTLDTALVYPGMCLFEATNVSEGRGTTRPFELFGAPFIEPDKLKSFLMQLKLPGVAFRVCAFRPTFDKYQHQTCFGLQLHVTSRRDFLPYQTGLALLLAIKTLYPNQFKWRTDTYEFRNDVPAIDLLTGFAQVRQAIDAEQSLSHIVSIASQGTELFELNRASCLLYD